MPTGFTPRNFTDTTGRCDPSQDGRGEEHQGVNVSQDVNVNEDVNLNKQDVNVNEDESLKSRQDLKVRPDIGDGNGTEDDQRTQGIGGRNTSGTKRGGRERTEDRDVQTQWKMRTRNGTRTARKATGRPTCTQ